MTRPTFDEYFMTIAHAVSKRGTCDRRRVGCVMIRDGRLLTSGYNGALSGMPHCDDVGHDLVESVGPDGVLRPNCQRAVHAEANAISQAARFGVSVSGATAYVNTYPCWPCFRIMAQAGVNEVVYDDEYRIDERVAAAASAMGISVRRVASPPICVESKP